MPVETLIWTIENEQPKPLNFQKLDAELKLHQWLEKDLGILDKNLFLIGSKVRTDHGKEIDLLALDEAGNVVIIELKKDKTPREVVAQVLDYATWISQLSYSNIDTIYSSYCLSKNLKNRDLATDFSDFFKCDQPDSLNESHRMVIVATELDFLTERIITYLSSNYGVPINVAFFRYFKDANKDYLARTWLIDPTIVEKQEQTLRVKRTKEEWNGLDWSVNIGQDEENVRNWQDCMKFGFVAAGGGPKYKRFMERLPIGARIFAYIKGKGYVGVGEVVDTAVPAKDFISDAYPDTTLYELYKRDSSLFVASDFFHDIEDFDNCEYLTKVKWIDHKPEEKAYWEKNLRTNQNVVFQLTHSFTIEKLTRFFDLTE